MGDEVPVEVTESGDAGDGDNSVFDPTFDAKQEDKEGKENVDQEKAGNDEVVGEEIEEAQGEQVEGEQVEDEAVEVEHLEEIEGENVEGEHFESKEKDEEKLLDEDQIGELEGEQEVEAHKVEEEIEEEGIEEEPPPDPAAPYDFSDSKEALKAPFELRTDQLAEVEQLWELYQDYTPSYSDLDGFVTEVELIYMLKCLLLMTYTPEQLQELVTYCVRPPHPEGHVNFEQFLKMVTIRQRDMPIEEELRCSLEVMDPDKSGLIDREYLRDVLGSRGLKMPSKHVENFIKEVDMSNDGTIGIEDVVGTLCIDLNRDDIVMLQNQINPTDQQNEHIDDLI